MIADRNVCPTVSCRHSCLHGQAVINSVKQTFLSARSSSHYHIKNGEKACALSPPQLSISRVLSPTRSPGDDHFSGPPVAEAALATVPGSAGRAILRHGVAPASCSLIWSCSRWGLPCLRCHHRSGELLPRRFTLTRRLALAGGLFSVALSLGSPPVAVSDHPAHGARTFLPSANCAKARSPVQLSGAHYPPQHPAESNESLVQKWEPRGLFRHENMRHDA